MTDARAVRTRRGPSPIFLGLLALTLVSGGALYLDIGSPGIVAFIFVLASWVVTLCLHEFAHALIAYRNGDESVVHRGYLTLDPLRYTHPVFSIVLPLVFVLLGGIGLPGGAVFIDHGALHTRGARSRVSAAGPLTNLLIAVVLAVAIAVGARSSGPFEFWAAIAFLLFLQVTAAVLNLLPVPGLDGFGIIEPYLPPAWVARAMRVAPFAILILFGLLWIPVVNAAFFGVILGILDAMGVPAVLIGAGYNLFQFWR
ncbi:MAG: site-2 protease family protein [Rhodoglobus sp.]